VKVGNSAIGPRRPSLYLWDFGGGAGWGAALRDNALFYLTLERYDDGWHAIVSIERTIAFGAHDNPVHIFHYNQMMDDMVEISNSQRLLREIALRNTCGLSVEDVLSRLKARMDLNKPSNLAALQINQHFHAQLANVPHEDFELCPSDYDHRDNGVDLPTVVRVYTFDNLYVVHEVRDSQSSTPPRTFWGCTPVSDARMVAIFYASPVSLDSAMIQLNSPKISVYADIFEHFPRVRDRDISLRDAIGFFAASKSFEDVQAWLHMSPIQREALITANARAFAESMRNKLLHSHEDPDEDVNADWQSWHMEDEDDEDEDEDEIESE